MYEGKEELLNLTLELVGIKSVSGTSDEAYVSNFVYQKLRELDYYKENPDHLFIQPINDELNRSFVCALMKSKKRRQRQF